MPREGGRTRTPMLFRILFARSDGYGLTHGLEFVSRAREGG